MFRFPSHHNAPEFSHKGYVYMPDLDDGDSDVVKVYHNVYRSIDLVHAKKYQTKPQPFFESRSFQDYSGYQYLTEKQFKEFIDKMDWSLQDGR